VILPDVGRLYPELHVRRAAIRARENHPIVIVIKPCGPVANREWTRSGGRLAGGGTAAFIAPTCRCINERVLHTVHSVKREIQVILKDLFGAEVRRAERSLPILVVRARSAVEIKMQRIAAPIALRRTFINHPTAGLVRHTVAAETVVIFLESAVNR